MIVPKTIPNYFNKWHYLWGKQGRRCAITGRILYLFMGEGDLHHLWPNSKTNRKKWPLFIHSVFNLVVVEHDAHMNYPLPKRIPEWRVDRIERGLQRHPMHSKRVNCEGE